MPLVPILALAASVAQPPPPPAEAMEPCAVDRPAMLALGIHAFDQDMEGGWRPLARRPECREAAADLIGLYRRFVEDRTRLLYWHEGQLRAAIGQSERAIALFERSRRGDADDYGWNPYVDATIAFLRGDRGALLAARERLARARLPEAAPGGRAFAAPLNLDVVDALIRCFGRPYQEAYGTAPCRAPEEPAR